MDSLSIPATRKQPMIDHMNDDHADALLLYVQHYGQRPDATAAKMDDIDLAGLALTATIDDEPVALRIPLDPQLENADEAHLRLVKMAKTARRALSST